MDLETTSLLPNKGRILEVAVGLADLGSPFTLAGVERFVLRYTDEHSYGEGCSQARGARTGPLHFVLDYGTRCRACDFAPEARAMHEESGLLAQCAESTTTVGEVEDRLLTLVLGEPERGSDKPTLAGSSVHFDLGFLRAHAPKFAARLSHRVYDVSAVKLFCESLGMPRISKAMAHRAAEDVLECAKWLTKFETAIGIEKRVVEPTLACSSMRDDRNPSASTFVDGSARDYATQDRTGPSDAYCVTTPDGGCSSTDPRDMHRPKGA